MCDKWASDSVRFCFDWLGANACLVSFLCEREFWFGSEKKGRTRCHFVRVWIICENPNTKKNTLGLDRIHPEAERINRISRQSVVVVSECCYAVRVDRFVNTHGTCFSGSGILVAKEKLIAT